MNLALSRFAHWIESKTNTYVCVSGVHGVMECQRSEELREIHNRAGMVTPDGMPLVWFCRWQGNPQADRVAGSDLLAACCERSVREGWRHFFYGGAPGVAEVLVARLRDQWPTLKVVGTHSPPFRPVTEQEDASEIELINRADPDIVWIGLSTPKQEWWMAYHVGRLQAPVLVGIGAAFDFVAGVKRRAPKWMQRSGLEWLFRLGSEPQRLWRRYLGLIPPFVGLLVLQITGLKRYDTTTAPARSDDRAKNEYPN
jgi:N-acetylglucosaminyldiphosphoundecaprenol N-acetyl-beta-D-mannosaminyltransferase